MMIFVLGFLTGAILVAAMLLVRARLDELHEERGRWDDRSDYL